MYILGVIEPVAVGQAAKDYLSRKVNPTLLKGLTHLCKQKPQDPVVSNVVWGSHMLEKYFNMEDFLET